jgi:hypothetical protein
MKVISLLITSALVFISGCASQAALDAHRPWSTKWMAGRLMEVDKNPTRIEGISSTAVYGGGNGSTVGAKAGGDIGSMGSGGLGERMVGAAVGAVVGSIGGIFYDKFGKPVDKDLYTVRAFNVNYHDSQVPYKSNWVVVRFDRKGYSYRTGDYIVLEKTSESVKGQKVYRAIDIFDVHKKDVHSMSYVKELQAKARETGQNMPVSEVAN